MLCFCSCECHAFRCQEAVALCERLLAVCPLYCPLLEITGEVHVSSGQADKAEALWTRAYSDSASSARIFYQLSRCLHAQVRLQLPLISAETQRRWPNAHF